jgi:hypothetical protein
MLWTAAVVVAVGTLAGVGVMTVSVTCAVRTARLVGSGGMAVIELLLLLLVVVVVVVVLEEGGFRAWEPLALTRVDRGGSVGAEDDPSTQKPHERLHRSCM